MKKNDEMMVQLDGYQPPKRQKRKFKPETENFVLDLLKKQGIPTYLRASDRSLELAYEKAYMLYNSGKYKEALPCFSLLMAADPDNAKYAFARAACHHMMHEYKSAIQFYTMAGVIEPESPLPFYYSSDCFIKMHDPFGALIALDVGLKRSHRAEYAQAIERMESMVKHLEHELGEKKTQSTQSFIKS